MANGNKVDFTKGELLGRLRKKLPTRYSLLSDEQLFNFISRVKPELKNVEFKPRPTPKPSVIEVVEAGTKEFIYRAPEVYASSFHSLVGSMFKPAEGKEGAANRFYTDLYKWARNKTEERIENDPQIRAVQAWNAENPFEWGRFLTDPTMFASVAIQVITSMGTMVGASALGGLIGGPAGAYVGASASMLALEGNEAYGEAVRRAEEKGMSPEEVNRLASESFLYYGAISAALEPLVPAITLRSFGLGRRVANKTFGKYLKNYVDDVVEGAKSGPQAAIDALKKTANQNLSITRRLVDLGKFTGIAQLGEATTEVTQFLAEQAILDNKIDGTQIDLPWLMEQWKNPELHASAAGGFIGGGLFAIPGGVQKQRGVGGKQAAERVHQLIEQSNVPDGKERSSLIASVAADILDSPDFSNQDKIDFSSTLMSLERESLLGRVKDIKYEEQKVAAEVEKEATKPEPSKVKKAAKKVAEKARETIKPKVTPPKEEKVAPTPTRAPNLTFIEEQEGRKATERALNWFLSEDNQRIKSRLGKLSDAEKKTLASLTGVAIEEITGTKVADKEGNFDPDTVFKVVNRLRTEGFKLAQEREPGIPSTPENIKAELSQEIGADITRSVLGDITGIESEIEKEVIGEVAPKPKKKSKITKEEREQFGVPERATGTEQIRYQPGPLEPQKIARGLVKPKEGQEIKLKKIISGGQTGVDRGGLVAASQLGLQTGGVAPFQFRTEKGTRETGLLKKFGLTEGPQGKNLGEHYKLRTKENIKNSDATLVIGKEASPGTIYTLNELERQGKPYIINPTKEEFTNWLRANEIETLNVAGPRESKEPGGQVSTASFIRDAIAGQKVEPKEAVKKKPITPEQVEKSRKKAAEAKKKVQEEKVKRPPGFSKEDSGTVGSDEDLSKDFFIDMLEEEVNRVQAKKNQPEWTSRQALNEIVKSPNSTKRQSLLAKFLLTRVPNIPVRVGAKDTYDSINNVITYSWRAATDEGDWIRSILHESSHAATSRIIKAIRAGKIKDPTILKAYNELERLREYVVNQVGKEKLDKIAYTVLKDAKVPAFESRELRDRYYGLFGGNIEEFVAETLSSQLFQDLLNNITYRNTTIWNKIVQILARLFGINTRADSALATAFRDSLLLIEYPVDVTQKMINDIFGHKERPIDAMDEFAGIIDPDRSEEERGDIVEVLIRERYGGDPNQALHSFFLNAYNVYIPRDQYPTLAKVANKYRDRSFRNRQNFYDFRDEMESTIEKVSGQKLNRDNRKQQHNIWLKGWFQHVNNSIPIDYEGGQTRKRAKVELILEPTEDPRARGYNNILAIKNMPKMQRKDKNRKNPERDLMSFPEYDFLYKGIPNKFWILTDKEIYLRLSEDNYRFADRGEISMTGDTIDLIDRYFAAEYAEDERDPKNKWLKVFMAETRGDNSKMIMTYVPYRYRGYRQEQFNTYLDDEVSEGNMAPVHRRIIKETVKPDPENPYVFAQWIGYYEAFKRVKGKRFLMRELNEDGTFNEKKTVMMAHKRLKLDFTEGWIPIGMGDSSIMVFDPKEVTMTAPDQNGNEQDITMFYEATRYSMDGFMLSSANVINRMNEVSGNYSRIYKTVVRHLGPNGIDYINFKMSESTPVEGMKVYRTVGDERQLVATYLDGIWKTPDGKKFDRLASTEERKEHDGEYSKLYEVLPLPEDTTRVIQVHDKSADMGAFPILGPELMLDNKYLEDEKANLYFRSVFDHYSTRAAQYLEEMYRFRDDPRALADFLQTSMKEGQIPSDIQQYILKDRTGKSLFLQQPMFQILPILVNHFIRDGLYKMRNRGFSTHLILKPRMAFQFNDDKSIIVSSDNRTMVDIVREQMNSPKATTADMNRWLKENDFWVLVHRQPIQGFTKIQPRKLQEFVDGNHGQSVFLSESDVFRVHEGDFDIDSVFIEYVNDSRLVDRLRDMIWDKDGNMREVFSSRDHTILLDIFKKGFLGVSQSSKTNVRRVMTNNIIFHALQGNAVAAKTMLATLSFKDISFSSRAYKDVTFTTYKPTDRVVMDYWEIREPDETWTEEEKKEYEKMKARLEAEGDKFVRIGNKLYLETTKENEFSILLQAAVDNEKFGLWSSIPGIRDIGVHNWLLTRIFKRTDGKPVWRVGQRINRKQPIGQLFSSFSSVYRAFNYGRDRSTLGLNREQQHYWNILQRSRDILDSYFDVNGLTLEQVKDIGKLRRFPAEVISGLLEGQIEKINNEKFGENPERVNDLYNFRTNGQITPVEWLLMQIGLYYYQNREQLMNENKDYVDSNPIGVSSEIYADAHRVVIDDLKSKWSSELQEGDLSPKDARTVFGYRAKDGTLAKGLYTQFNEEFYDRWDEEGNFDRQKNEAFEDKWFKKFHVELKNSAIHKWVTIMFLRGAKVKEFQGRRLKIINLPSLYLVHGPTIAEYGKRMYEEMFKPIDQKKEPAKVGEYELAKAINEFREKYCA